MKYEKFSRICLLLFPHRAAGVVTYICYTKRACEYRSEFGSKKLCNGFHISHLALNLTLMSALWTICSCGMTLGDLSGKTVDLTGQIDTLV